MNANTGKGGDFELIVHGGTLIIPGIGRVRADVGMAGGRITAIGENLAGGANERYDASGKVVIPGVFDPHTHIGNQFSFEEEATTETRAAIIGGVTTIGIFLRCLEESYLENLPAFRRAMDERSYVDSVFHPQIFNELQLSEVPRMAEDFGIRSFKMYMSGLPGIVPSVTDDFLLQGFKTIASIGPDAVACVHCETGKLVDQARDALRRDVPEGTLADWEKAHPPEAEALAIQTAAYLARLAGAHLYVVHLSSLQGLEVVRRLRATGQKFTVETTSPYLGLSSNDDIGFLIKMVPPIRSPEHGDALWQGLREGSIDTLGTDNTSRNRQAKNPDGGLHGSKPGLPALGAHLPALLHNARKRGLPLEMLVDKMCSAPARVYGIYPKKGTITVGGDADLVVIDPDLEKVARGKDMHGMSDFTPFEGKKLVGWPVATVKGGRVVARDGEVVAEPSGRYLPRYPAGTQSLAA